MTQIYLDNAATTPLLDEVIDAMVVVMKKQFRESFFYTYPWSRSQNILEETRRKIAHELHVSPRNYLHFLRN